MQTKTLKISAIGRAPNSTNGNPRYDLEFEDGSTYRTEADSSYASDIGNPGYREGDRVTITLTNHKHPKISKIERAADEPDAPRLAYAVYRHDFEEATKRAVAVLAVLPTQQAAEEYRCYCYIEDAQADAEAEAEDVAEQIAEGFTPDEPMGFYGCLSCAIEDESGVYNVTETAVY